MKFLKSIFSMILLPVLLVYIISHFVFSPYAINGQSMLPTYQGGERVIVNKLAYTLFEPDYEEIVIFHEEKEQKHLVKRIVGLPGDTIEIKDGYLVRNGVIYEEPYVLEETSSNFEAVTVPEGHVYVLGDNRNNSTDSRVLGTIPEEDIIGKVSWIISK